MALTQVQFAKLFDGAMRELDLTNREVAERTAHDGHPKPIDPGTIAEYRKADYPHRPPVARKRRRLERAMEVYRGYLDGDWPKLRPVEQRLRLRQGEAPQTALHAAPAPVQRRTPAVGAGALRETLDFLRGQLEGYKRDGRPIPYLIVESWLAELENSTSEPAPALEPDAAGSGSGSPTVAPPRKSAKGR